LARLGGAIGRFVVLRCRGLAVPPSGASVCAAAPSVLLGDSEEGRGDGAGAAPVCGVCNSSAGGALGSGPAWPCALETDRRSPRPVPSAAIKAMAPSDSEPMVAHCFVWLFAEAFLWRSGLMLREAVW